MAPSELIDLCETFNSKLLALINMINVDQSTDFERLKTRTRIVVKTNPLLVLEQGYNHIWSHKQELLKVYDAEKNTYDWGVFYNHNLDDSIINEAESNNVPIHLLFNCIKEAFVKLSEMEKIKIYEHVLEILQIVKQYKKLIKN